MAQVNAGRVRFVSRGEYNNSTQYYLFDLVDYNGSSYFAKANTTGNVPTNTTYWQLVAEKGNTGGDGPVGPTGNGIASIIKTGTAGLIDTYTITFTDGTITTFNVTNGQDGDVTQEYVDEENERLKSVFNVLPKVSGTGESVTLDNTGDTMLYKIDLKGNTSQDVVQGEVGLEEEDTSIYVDDVNEDKENYITLKGNTYQETTTGKNLLNVDITTMKNLNTGGTWNDNVYTHNGLTITINKNKTIKINGTSTAQETLLIENKQISYPTGTYYLSGSINGNNSLYDIRIFNYDGTSVVVQCFTGTKEVNIINNSQYYNLAIVVRSGQTLNNVLFYPMLTKTQDNTYEPYTNGASPNPDYPQDIHIVSGDNTIKVCGKNLFDKDSVVSGFVNADGTIGGDTNAYRTSNFIPIQPNTAYYKTRTDSPRTKYYDSNKQPLNTTAYQDISIGGNEGTFTTPNNACYLRFSYPVASVDANNIMVHKGTTSTSYEPYQSTTYPISLEDIELCKIGDYKDRIYPLNGKWYLEKKIGKVVLDGSENWVKHGSIASWFYYDSITNGYVLDNTQVLIKTNYYTPKAYQGVPNLVNGECSYGSSDGGITHRFVIKNTDYTQIQDFKNWLSTHNTSVYYALATATDTQITDTTLISQLNALYNATIYSTTHINTETSNLLPYINLKYNVVTASPSPERASEVEVVKGNNTITISNEDGTKTQSYNITLGNLELCKIGNYQDYFYKENGNWYKYGAIGKTTDVVGSTSITINNMVSNGGMYSLYGGTLSNKTITYDSALLRQNTIYYPLATPTSTEITDQLLVSQLDELQKAMSYYDKTIITQTNADKPFILDVIGIRDLQDIFNLISGE